MWLTKSAIAVMLLLAIIPMAYATDPTTTVTLRCHGSHTTASAVVQLTHNGRVIAEVTLSCTTGHNQSTQVRTGVKPNDWHVELSMESAAGTMECHANGTMFPAFVRCSISNGAGFFGFFLFPFLFCCSNSGNGGTVGIMRPH